MCFRIYVQRVVPFRLCSMKYSEDDEGMQHEAPILSFRFLTATPSRIVVWKSDYSDQTCIVVLIVV